MSNYNSLKATINANVKTNGNQEITGSVLNSVLNAMVNTLGAGYQYMGVATPSTNPGTPDEKVFYIATAPGTYVNFNNQTVLDGEVVILKYANVWVKEITGIATAEQILQLSYILHRDWKTYRGWMSGNNGQYESTISHKFTVIPIVGGVDYRFVCNGTPCHLAFLKSFDGVPTTSFDVSGNRIVITPVGTEVTGIVPEDAHYLYILKEYNYNNIEIPTITIGGVTVSNTLDLQIIDILRLLHEIGETTGNNADLLSEILQILDYQAGHTDRISELNNYYLNSNSATLVASTTVKISNPIYLNPGDKIKVVSPAMSWDTYAVVGKASGADLLTATFVPIQVVPTGSGYGQTFEYTVTEAGYYVVSYAAQYSSAYGEIQYAERSVIGSLQEQVNENTEDISEINQILGVVQEYTERVVPENPYYIRPSDNILIATSASPYVKVTNPVWLNVGDVVKIVSPGMTWPDRAVLARASGADLLTSRFECIEVSSTGSGYGTTYQYTIQESGYYILSYATIYSSAYAEITHIATNNVDKLENRADEMEQTLSELSDRIGVSSNVFGDILPKLFWEKYFGSVEDVEVVCVGDSLTGLIDYSGVLENPEHQSPGMLYKHWTYNLWERICLNKPMCDRLDSQRDGVDVFSKTGTWVEYVNNTSGDYGDNSVSANTFMSNSSNAAVSFPLDLDAYEKCNIVFSANPDGENGEIVISGGNGKLLASLDKETWVEANGFQVNEGTTDIRERHRRVWMKRADGATGVVTVSFRAVNSDTSKYLYFWGTEKWNGASLFLTNLGRGGKNMTILSRNRMDIFDRKPDLCILELPLANETVIGANTLESLKLIYNNALILYKQLSANYTETEFLFVLPTGRTQYFDGNQAVEYVSSGTATMKNHLMAKAIFGYVAQLTKNYRENVGMVNLMDQVYNEGFNRSYTIQAWLAPSSLTLPTITRDGVHLNQLGSAFWAKYLASIFQ